MNNYNIQTAKTLGTILAPDCPEKYQIIFADMLKSMIIPWHQKEEVLSEHNLIQLVKQTVCNSFKYYTGSCEGYTTSENERLLLYAVLWGDKRGTSLTNEDFLDKPVTCDYDSETKQFTISLLPDDRPIAYSERQLKWCRENAPKSKQNLSDAEITDIMYPAWTEFGEFSTRLPEPIPTSDEQKEFINHLESEVLS